MNNLKFLVLEGDGIGPETTASSIAVLKAALAIFDLKVDLVFDDVGFASLKKYKTTIRNEVLQIGEEVRRHYTRAMFAQRLSTNK